MPLIPPDLAARLSRACDGCFAAMPRREGRGGHPVLLARAAFPAIAALTGDAGAGKLLVSRDDVAFVDCTAESIHADVDRVEDIARLEGSRDA